MDGNGDDRLATARVDNAPRWEIQVELSEAEFTQALNRFWLRRYRTNTALKPVLLVVAVACSFSGIDTIWLAMIWTAIAYSVLQYIAAYVRYLRNSRSTFREMEAHSVHYVFNDTGITTNVAVGTSQVRWRTVSGLWRYPGMWLLVLRKMQIFILPTRDLPAELRMFIERRVELGGGHHAT